MFAVGIFFLAVFSIMGVISTGLGAAGRLQSNVPDAGWVVADIWRGPLEEGELYEGDFGDFYPGFSWKAEAVEYRTNSLFLVNITIQGDRQGKPYESITEILMWRANPRVSLRSGGRRGGAQ